jgi:tripartite-type tricarboxylate transporter receptor subunit TctC
MSTPILNRRTILQMGLAGAVAVTVPDAKAQAYPSRPITIVSPFPPGGAETLLRLMLPTLQARLGQPVVIDYTVGASGLIGSERVARAAADGYTLLYAPASVLTATLLYRHSKVDLQRDFTPIINTHEVPQVLVAHPSLAASSVTELIALAKNRAEPLAFGSAGNGSVLHLNGELFNTAAEVKLLHVPYKGTGPMVADLLAGRVPITFNTITHSQSFIAAGKLKALAILDNKRSPFLPGVPAITEALPNFRQSDTWSSILAPAATPAAIVDTLYNAFRQVLEVKEVRTLFADNFAYINALTPKQTGERMRSDLDRTRKLMKAAGIEQE